MSERALPPATARLVLWSLAVMIPVAGTLGTVSAMTFKAGEGYAHHFWSVLGGLLADLHVALLPTALAGIMGLLGGMALVAAVVNLGAAVRARRAGRPARAEDFAGPCRAAVFVGMAALLLALVVAATAEGRNIAPSLKIPLTMRVAPDLNASVRLGAAVCLITWGGAGILRLLLEAVCRDES